MGASAARISTLRSIANWTHSDYSQYCSPTPTEGTYLCEEGQKDDEMGRLEAQVQQLEQNIDSTPVNEYSQISVDSYNAKVNTLNGYINKYNGILASSCIDISKFCKEYEASGKNTDVKESDDASGAGSSQDIDESIVWIVVLVAGGGIFMWNRRSDPTN